MEPLKDDLLNLAFQLAYFIQRDKELAKRITVAALEKVETTALAQDKRLYYTGRRNKVSMTELHLLQRLVYGESEDFERQRESDPANPPSEETMLIHFIKHLVRITVKRNSLYVTLGLSRLLHQYTTTEAQELYNLVVQDPNRVPSEDYCRSRKKNLMEELKKRFGDLLTTARGTRGEERFAAHSQPERFLDLVRACLATFTPWRTYCCVPDGFAPTSDALTTLVFGGGDPDAEHDIEVNRFHAVLHPDCFAKLIRGLGYSLPAERLEVPRFALTQANADDGAQPPAPPPNDPSASLDESERDSIRHQLENKAGRRKNLTAGLLHFVVDGAEVAQLDLRQVTQTNFRLPDDAEFIEVRAHDVAGDVVLATHALVYGADDLPRSQQTALVLEGGQQLSFQISPARDRSGSLSGATATVHYRETRPWRALRLWWQRQYRPVSAPPLWLAPQRLLLPLSVVLLATTLTLATLWYRERQAHQYALAERSQIQTEQQRLAEQYKQSIQEKEAVAAQLKDAQTKTGQLLAQRDEARLAQQNIYTAAVVRLAAVRSTGESEPISIPSGVKTFILPLRYSNPRDFRAYTLVIHDAGGAEVARIPDLKPLGADHTLNPTLPRKAFKPGTYQLQLYGQGQALKSLGIFDVRLSFE